jgi:hypothetical protein
LEVSFELLVKTFGLAIGLWVISRCNVAHNPDLRNTTYEPAFPLMCCLLSPFPSVTSTTAVFAVVITATTIYVASAVAAVFNVAAAFTVIAATFTVIATVVTITAAVSITSAVFTATAAISVSSASASDRSPHSVSSVRLWSYYPLAPFPQSVTSI